MYGTGFVMVLECVLVVVGAFCIFAVNRAA